MTSKKRTVEQRFPTKRARDLADEATDKLPVTEPMHVHTSLWLETYLANGGVDRGPG